MPTLLIFPFALDIGFPIEDTCTVATGVKLRLGVI